MSTATDGAIVRRELDTERPAAVQVVEVIADLDGKRISELETAYRHLGHVLDDLFSTPPAADAQVEVSFTYEGYRVKIEQDGTTTFRRLD